MFFLRFSETLHFWRHHLLPLFAVTAPFALLDLLVQWYLGMPWTLTGSQVNLHPAPLVLLMLIWPLAEGSLVAQLAAIQAGNKHPFWFCFLIAIRTGPTLLLANLIMTAAMSAGFLLLILPGLWLYGRFAMLPFVLVLENESPLAALRKSFVRSHAQQWPLLGGMLFFGLLAFSLIDLLGTALASVSFLPGWAAPMLAALAYSLLGALKDVYVFRFYLLSRSSSERVPSNRT